MYMWRQGRLRLRLSEEFFLLRAKTGVQSMEGRISLFRESSHLFINTNLTILARIDKTREKD